MTNIQIAVLVGSLRKESHNRKLADGLAKLVPKTVSLKQVRIDDLPLYNQDADTNQAPSVQRLKREIAASQGVLFISPEYNRSISSVLKTAIDHVSRPYGQSSWKGKPAGLIGVSPGVTGTSMAQQHLRNVLVSLDMPTMAQPEAFIQAKADLFDAHGNIGEASNAFLRNWMNHYVAWVLKMQPDKVAIKTAA